MYYTSQFMIFILLELQQFTKLLQLQENENHELRGIVHTFLQNRSESGLVRACVELMYLHGLRISEVLSINLRNVSKSGTIKVQGSKGSSDRFVRGVIFNDFWKKSAGRTIIVGEDYSRWYFYRTMKKAGIVLKKKNGVNSKVTHALRHLYAQEVQGIDDNKENITTALGHKSKDSRRFYEKDK